MATIDNIIARVQKLRALATTSNEHEAANAASAAAKLIDQHQLSEMDLQVSGEKAAEPVEIIETPLFRTGRIMLWQDRLSSAIAEHYGVSIYIKSYPLPVDIMSPQDGRDTDKGLTMVGRPSDAEVVRYMFTWLMPVVVQLTKNNAYGRGMAYSQNYALGVVEGIRTQLMALRQETKRQVQSQAMVLLDNRLAVSQAYLKTNLKLRTRKSHLRGNEDAMAQGKKVGEKIQLQKGLTGGQTQTKLLT